MNDISKTRLRTAFIFKSGRRKRMEQTGSFPTEFFYGFLQLMRKDGELVALEDGDFGFHDRMHVLWRIPSTIIYNLTGLHVYIIWIFLRRHARRIFADFDQIVVSTTAAGVALACLKRLSLFRPKLVFIVMGALDLQTSPLRRWIVRALLRNITIITISRGEEETLRQELGPKADIHYMPFGVDPTFWQPRVEKVDAEEDTPYVLSIGNDQKRDYETLVKAWKPEYPVLKIITSLPIRQSRSNVIVERGNWNEQIKTDEEIRSSYQNALFIVLPLKQTTQPSGQSVCLQAMACAKAVVLSDTTGLWDRDLMRSGETCLLTQPGSVTDIQNAVESLLKDAELRDALEQKARAVIDNHLNVNVMAARLNDILFTAKQGL